MFGELLRVAQHATLDAELAYESYEPHASVADLLRRLDATHADVSCVVAVNAHIEVSWDLSEFTIQLVPRARHASVRLCTRLLAASQVQPLRAHKSLRRAASCVDALRRGFAATGGLRLPADGGRSSAARCVACPQGAGIAESDCLGGAPRLREKGYRTSLARSPRAGWTGLRSFTCAHCLATSSVLPPMERNSARLRPRSSGRN